MKLKAIVALLLLMVAGLQVSVAQVNHPYVDLALPSGTLWAAYNVGATSAEQPGTFFAWGETKGKTEYNRSTYQIGGELTHGYKNISKYVTKSEYGKDGITDNMSTLLPEDDAATANWGGDWVMPTLEQIEELCDPNITFSRFATMNGVKGRVFTSKINGNSLFLPGTGVYDALCFCDNKYLGFYWSRSLNPEMNSHAYGLYIYVRGECGPLNTWRTDGLVVRPVLKKKRENP